MLLMFVEAFRFLTFLNPKGFLAISAVKPLDWVIRL